MNKNLNKIEIVKYFSKGKKMLLKDIATVYFSLPNKNNQTSSNLWITSANLFENNVIKVIKEENLFDLDSCTLVKHNDILLKRISPTYVNVFGTFENTFAGTNILVIRTSYNPYYIAYILNQKLKELNSLANNSTRFNAINRNMLENINIPAISKENQNNIGEIWKLLNKKQQLLDKLKNNEQQKKLIIEKQMLNKIGE